MEKNNEEKFQKILLENESLYELITNNKISFSSKFPNKSNFSTEFIDWLSPKYYDTFVYIYKNNILENNESKIISLIRKTRYCNLQTENKIVDFLIPDINSVVEFLNKIVSEINNNTILSNILVTNVILKNTNIEIFKKFEFQKIQKIKNIVIEDCLKICDSLKKTKASNELSFSIFTATLNKLEKFHLYPYLLGGIR